MWREAFQFLFGVVAHTGRVMTFQADGTGLPNRPGGALYALIVIAVLMTTLRYAIVQGSQPPIMAGAGALLVIMCVALIFEGNRLPCFGMYLCLRSGIDLTAMISAAAGLGDGGWHLGIWEIAGVAYGWYRFERRAHRPVIK